MTKPIINKLVGPTPSIANPPFSTSGKIVSLDQADISTCSPNQLNPIRDVEMFVDRKVTKHDVPTPLIAFGPIPMVGEKVTEVAEVDATMSNAILASPSGGPVDPTYLEGCSPERIETILNIPEYTNEAWDDAESNESSNGSSDGFNIPLRPLLVEVLRSVGLCLYQLTPNALMYFEGFCYRLKELGLLVSLESFHTLFSIRKMPNDSYFYFYPRVGKKLDLASLHTRRLHQNLGSSATRHPSGRNVVPFGRIEKDDVCRTEGSRNISKYGDGNRLSSPPPCESVERRSTICDPPNIGVVPHFDTPSGGSSKRRREFSLAAAPPHGAGKGFFGFRMNRVERVESFWDDNENSVGWNKTRCPINKYDIERLNVKSDKVIAEARAGESEKYKESLEYYEAAAKSSGEEITKMFKDLCNIKEELKTSNENLKVMKEKYDREIATGKKFLESEVGKDMIHNAKERVSSTFQASPAFEEIAMQCVVSVYDDTIRHCRRILWDSGQVSEDVIMLLKPHIPEVEGDTVAVENSVTQAANECEVVTSTVEVIDVGPHG
ncbi:hypothetical protein DH2020_046535 [Rehmannia glutinosa]|uniref:Uncharacterized protein n=1 Tax=Rehmannia glutinosa TaxID=99300 RepID=A0ABR0UBN9_REHGL